MNRLRWIAPLLAACLLAGPGIAPAQTYPSTPAPASAPMAQDLLDSLLAPIALYPDQLLSQVLMASTYPLEVVEAARFVKANPNLRGADLDRALQDKAWDPSVLSLCAFPQVLDMMDTHLDWTQRLGDAFLLDEAAVMRTVQALRQRAQQAGNLQSTEQQRVIYDNSSIVIEPAQPQYVYVPVYNPQIIYGPWWAPAYTPWYWYPGTLWGYPPAPPTWGYAAGFFWGSAWAITSYNWGWCRPNWGGYNINVNVHGNNPWVNRPYYHNRYVNNPNWTHAPEHRRGVAYRDAGTAQRYRPDNPGAVQTRENYRGRDNLARPAPGTGYDRPQGQGGGTRPAPGTGGERPPQGAGGGSTTQPMPRPVQPPPLVNTRPVQPPSTPTTTQQQATRPVHPGPAAGVPMSRPAPPTGAQQPTGYRPESRPQIQRDAARGAQSRATMPTPVAPSVQSGGARPAAPSGPVGAPAPAPVGQGGNRGGGQGGGGQAGHGGGQGGGQPHQR